MTQPSLRWCPHCREPKLQAATLHLRDHFEPVHRDPAPDDPQAQRRRWYCTDCAGVWDSWELPQAFVVELLTLRDRLEKAERQATLLRLLLAKERGEAFQEQTAPLSRAA